ncbi:MAG: hypothetical protein JXO44_06505, partial [Clostridia bacterium]|nr:hypothetical protein [Clostridia bacterium]
MAGKKTIKNETAKEKAKKTTTKSKSKRQPAAKKETSKKQSILIYELKLIALVTLTVILASALHTDAIGIFGVYAKKCLFGLFAHAGYITPYLLFVIVFVKINHNLEEVRVKYILASVFLFLSVLLTLTTMSYDLIDETLKFNNVALFSSAGVIESFNNGVAGDGGGVLGNWLTFAMVGVFGKMGTYIIAVCLLVGTFILGTRMTVGEMIEKQKEKQTAKKELKAIKATQVAAQAPQQIHVDDVPKQKNFKSFDSSTYIDEKPTVKK